MKLIKKPKKNLRKSKKTKVSDKTKLNKVYWEAWTALLLINLNWDTCMKDEGARTELKEQLVDLLEIIKNNSDRNLD